MSPMHERGGRGLAARMPRLRARIKRRRLREQVSTSRTTILAVMRSPHFTFGVEDARAGRPFRADYEKWGGNAQWNYERGRQWAVLVPPRVALKTPGGQLSLTAIHWFKLNDEYIL